LCLQSTLRQLDARFVTHYQDDGHQHVEDTGSQEGEPVRPGGQHDSHSRGRRGDLPKADVVSGVRRCQGKLRMKDFRSVSTQAITCEGQTTYEGSNVDTKVEDKQIPLNGRLGIDNDTFSALQGLDGGSRDGRLITKQRSQTRLDEAGGEGQ
jgi:hypothetical protein